MPRANRFWIPIGMAAAALAVSTSCSREPRSRPYSEIEAERQARIAAAEAAAAEQEALAREFAPPSGSIPAPENAETLSPDARDAETRRRLALLEQAMNSSSVTLDGPTSDTSEQPAWESRPEASATLPEPAPEEPPIPAIASVAEPPRAVVVADAPAAAELTEEERVAMASDPLVRTLREEVGTADVPVEVLIQLAALNAIRPDALAESDISGDTAMRALSDSERTLVQAWRDLHAAARSEAETGDVAELARLLTEAAERVRGLQPLEITRAALCTRVERFGVFDEVPMYGGVHKMIAGRPQRVLLYIELDNFSHRPDTQGDAEGWTVDLTVGLTLHHLGRQTDLLAWRMADETVRVFSRNQRREFFLSIVADLPASISVDSYALKAQVRDTNSGATAERVIRIDMVADASALVTATD